MIKRRNLRTRSVKMFILDESDEMLNKGFKEQIYDVYRFVSRYKIGSRYNRWTINIKNWKVLVLLDVKTLKKVIHHSDLLVIVLRSQLQNNKTGILRAGIYLPPPKSSWYQPPSHTMFWNLPTSSWQILYESLLNGTQNEKSPACFN